MSRKRKSRELEVQAAVKASPSAQRWVRWLAPLLVALFTLTAFLPTLQNQFVAWDDDKNFLDNPRYRGLGWAHLRWMFTAFHLGHYIPLTWVTFGMDHLLWGMKPVGYHLTSLLLHAANAVLFFSLVRRILTLALPSAAERDHALVVSAGFAALVFAIHPLRVESVAWVTERRDVLSGLFYLLTILEYLRACEPEKRGRWWYWLSVVTFVCALLSKSMVVNLPVVLLILDVYPLRRLGGAIGWWSEPARRVYVEKIPFVLLAAAASAIAFMAQFSAQTAASLAQLSVLGRLAVSAYGLSFYLGKLVVPVNLSPLYELPPTVNPGALPFILSYGLVLAITALVLVLRRRAPGLLATWLAYIVVLLPVLGIFQIGLQIAADRYTYLARLGWAILAEAIDHWRQALRMMPDYARAHTNWGAALGRQGKPAEAIDHYRQALRIKPGDALAHTNWGVELAQQGKLAEAIEHFQEALRIKPDDALAHTNLGLALTLQGKLAEAFEHLQRGAKAKK